LTCVRDINSEEALERELERIRKFFQTKEKSEVLRIEWGTKDAFESQEAADKKLLTKIEEDVKELKEFMQEERQGMRRKGEIEKKIEELQNADLDKMVLDEVEYGKFWLRWALGLEKHETKMGKVVTQGGGSK